jgi:hypothetical protein
MPRSGRLAHEAHIWDLSANHDERTTKMYTGIHDVDERKRAAVAFIVPPRTRKCSHQGTKKRQERRVAPGK